MYLNRFGRLITETGNEFFGVSNHFLLVDVCSHLCFLQLFAENQVSGIIGFEIVNTTECNFNRTVGNRIKESPVMRNKYHCTIVSSQEIFEPLNRFNIKVVGGLIQKQNIPVAGKKRSQCHATLLATREVADDGLPRDVSDKTGENIANIYLLLGAEPSRNWQTFAAEVIDLALAADISGIVFLGALLAEVPHTRPTPIFISSENPAVRSQFDVERSSYEGPVGILTVLADVAERAGIPTMSVWASVPHYVHHAPSPKATLAIIDRLEEIVDVTIPRGSLVDEAEAWVANVDSLSEDDEDMAAYIQGLERSRDAFDSPEASGEALAQEFERFLRPSCR